MTERSEHGWGEDGGRTVAARTLTVRFRVRVTFRVRVRPRSEAAVLPGAVLRVRGVSGIVKA